MSQIANVILSGGDDGMWTLDRYQRWMEQKSDWVRPAARPAAAAAETMKVVRVPKAALPSAAATDPQAEIAIDEDLDREELAALARKIEERTR
jgi:hypothetical protein